MPYMGHFKRYFYPYIAISSPSVGMEIAFATSVKGLDDPAMQSKLRVAINRKNATS